MGADWLREHAVAWRTVAAILNFVNWRDLERRDLRGIKVREEWGRGLIG